jgi:hypothetical protein
MGGVDRLMELVGRLRLAEISNYEADSSANSQRVRELIKDEENKFRPTTSHKGPGKVKST